MYSTQLSDAHLTPGECTQYDDDRLLFRLCRLDVVVRGEDDDDDDDDDVVDEILADVRRAVVAGGSVLAQPCSVSWWYLVIVAACHSVHIIIIIIITSTQVKETSQTNAVRKDSCTADILSYVVIATENGKLNWKMSQQTLYSAVNITHWRNVLRHHNKSLSERNPSSYSNTDCDQWSNQDWRCV